MTGTMAGLCLHYEPNTCGTCPFVAGRNAHSKPTPTMSLIWRDIIHRSPDETGLLMVIV